MVLRARFVAPMNRPPIEDGAVRIRRADVIAVGKSSEIGAENSEEILDLGDSVLLPGLINAHCHLDYTCLRGQIPPTGSFTQWIRAINAAKAQLTADDYLASINAGFAEAQMFGTTMLANLTAFPELAAQVRSPIRTWWFGELIDVRDPAQATALAERAAESLRDCENFGLAPHAPFTASAELFAACERIANDRRALLTTHVAESREEMEMFRDARGALFDFLKSLGRPMDDCGTGTALSAVLRGAELNENWIVAHLNEITDCDLALLKKSSRFHIAHCPRSHAFFRHTRFQFHKLRELGFRISLATDSLASNDDLSLFAEMRAFQREFSDVSAAEILQMVTRNPAAALHQGNRLGLISLGSAADLLAIPFLGNAKTVFEEVVEFSGTVPWLMVAGKIKR